MTYEEAKAHRAELEQRVREDSDRLRQFDKYGKTAIGMTPDHVRAMPEWKSAKQACDKSFAELRDFNAGFVKMFKKEYAKDRHNRRA